VLAQHRFAARETTSFAAGGGDLCWPAGPWRRCAQRCSTASLASLTAGRRQRRSGAIRIDSSRLAWCRLAGTGVPVHPAGQLRQVTSGGEQIRPASRRLTRPAADQVEHGCQTRWWIYRRRTVWRHCAAPPVTRDPPPEGRYRTIAFDGVASARASSRCPAITRKTQRARAGNPNRRNKKNGFTAITFSPLNPSQPRQAGKLPPRGGPYPVEWTGISCPISREFRRWVRHARRFTEEHKDQAVAFVIEGNRSVADVARIHEMTLGK
jgi:hypothetical protein